MPAWWVTFSDVNASAACVEAPTQHIAEQLAAELTDMDVYHIGRLPYPAEPRLTHEIGLSGSPCPSFCWTPTHCVGMRACPHDPGCSS